MALSRFWNQGRRQPALSRSIHLLCPRFKSLHHQLFTFSLDVDVEMINLRAVCEENIANIVPTNVAKGDGQVSSEALVSKTTIVRWFMSALAPTLTFGCAVPSWPRVLGRTCISTCPPQSIRLNNWSLSNHRGPPATVRSGNECDHIISDGFNNFYCTFPRSRNRQCWQYPHQALLQPGFSPSDYYDS